ncbi:hypothetical protein UCRNP2_1240 [Neofusicoccum parvum UCRNP2]|uniref:Pal1-like protein n=1 Tax=Botryosphaeria parva (strain UCR-NP2) TaxID=1287680 RepID=R1H0N1_BOTPV|nr:hypothetical protein UCRNP2_1240 [Neofusicoccum parvum UCRNP2]
MAALRSAASKAVHLKVYPRPASLSESRELLGVLQQFGEVTMFKSLRFDYVQPAPNTCLAIYRDATSAARLLQASPLRFTLEPIAGEHAADPHDHNLEPARDGGRVSELDPHADPEVADVMEDAEFNITNGPSKSGAEEMIRPSTLLYQTIDSFSRPKEDARSSTVSDAAESDANPARPDAELVDQPDGHYAVEQPDPDPAPKHVPEPKPPRVFHVVADVSEMNHRDYIERSFWYGPYMPRKRSAAYQDLTARGVPPGIADVHANKPEQTMRFVQQLREDVSRRPSLKQIWERGQAQRAKDLESPASGPSIEEPR